MRPRAAASAARRNQPSPRRSDAPHRARPARADKKVFPKFDVVGWYATGAELQEADLDLQRTVRASGARARLVTTLNCAVRAPQMMTTITESPLFVLFNPAVRSVASKDLPITLYESGAPRERASASRAR